MGREPFLQLRNLFFPAKCVHCGTLVNIGEALCDSCLDAYDEAKLRKCSKCHEYLCDCTCSGTFLRNRGIRRLRKVFFYSPAHKDTPENNLLYALKDRHSHNSVRFLAAELADVLRTEGDLSRYTITYVPASRRRMVEKGFDHMKELAGALSHELSIPYARTLKNLKGFATPQKELSREERIASAEGKYRCILKPRKVQRRYILLDDICTTGATLASAAKALKEGGASFVLCAVLASGRGPQD